MSTESITSNRTQCRPEFDYIRPVNFKTTGDLGEALLDSFESRSLEQGEKLCYRFEANNVASWFVYLPREAKPVEKSSSGDVKEAFSVLGAIALLSLFVTSAFKTIIDGATYAVGGVADDAALAKEGAAMETLSMPAALGMENEPWWLGLTETDRRRMDMIIGRELPRALEGEEFRRLYLDDAGRVTPEGLSSLLGSQGNVDHPLGRIDARSSSMEARRAERGKRGRFRDFVRSFRGVK